MHLPSTALGPLACLTLTLTLGTAGCYASHAAHSVAWRADRADRAEAPANPGFSRLLDGYARAVRAFGSRAHGDGSHPLHRALDGLAATLERTPRSADFPMVDVAAQIRAEIEELAAVDANRVGRSDGLKDALDAAASVLQDLAEGPYRQDPAVLAASVQFTRSLEAIDPGRSVRANRRSVLLSLVSAERALRAIERSAEVPKPMRR